MKNNKSNKPQSSRRRIIRILAIILGVVFMSTLFLLVIGPFLVPVTPLEGLISTEQAAVDDSHFVTIPFEGTDGINIHYLAGELEASDEEPTFVLLHGSMFNAFTWNEVMDYFDEQGKVIAYDQIPYGLSEKLLEEDWADINPYESESAVEQLFAFLDELGEDNVILVGNSYGGVLAVQAALAYPERVDALILADAAVYVQEEMPAEMLELPQVRRLGPLFARSLGQNEAFIRQTYMNPDDISDERLALTMSMTLIEDWDLALWEYLRVWGVDDPDYKSRISEIKQPTLVISGDSDVVVPVEDSQRLDSELPNSEFVILPSCGHVPQEECPELFAEAVVKWLRK